MPDTNKKLKLDDLINIKAIEKIAKESLSNQLSKASPAIKASVDIIKENRHIEKAKKILAEALVLVPKSFVLKTEQLSSTTKEIHLSLYKNYVDSFNLISAKLDSLRKEEPRVNNPNNSEFRRNKLDEQHNLNGVKLHELYFGNISDLNSMLRQDTIPFMRLSRDWGTFDDWQLDFRACGMNAMEGWAVLYFDPYKQKYMNSFIEKHSENVSVMGIPVLVVDTWHHAWFKDYPGDKLEYMNAMMNEINWAVVEARMLIAEMANLHKLYLVEPVGVTETPKSVSLTPFQAPIAKDKVVPTQNVTMATDNNGVQR